MGWKGCNQSNIVITSSYSEIWNHMKLAKIVALQPPTVYLGLRNCSIVWLITANKVKMLWHMEKCFHSNIRVALLFRKLCSFVTTNFTFNRFTSNVRTKFYTWNCCDHIRKINSVWRHLLLNKSLMLLLILVLMFALLNYSCKFC